MKDYESLRELALGKRKELGITLFLRRGMLVWLRERLSLNSFQFSRDSQLKSDEIEVSELFQKETIHLLAHLVIQHQAKRGND